PRARAARLVRGGGDRGLYVLAGDSQREREWRVLRLSFVEASLVAGVNRKGRGGCLLRRGEIALHGLGELDADLHGGRGSRYGWQPVIDFPAAVLSEKGHRALGHGGNGEQRIHAYRPRDNGAIDHIKALVNGGARTA